MLQRLFSLSDSIASPLVRDALDVWRVGVEAVIPQNLFRRKLRIENRKLMIEDACEIDLSQTRRLIVVGAGKASAAMAMALEQLIASRRPASGFPKLVGWINAPEGSLDKEIPGIHIHAARPAGINVPTQSAMDGTTEILKLVSTANQEDIVLCLISGGGSALMVAPHPGISLLEKQDVATSIAAAGGNIRQLNIVRRALSRVKGGGLARECTAGRLVSLVISDVLGDPLDIIASGPTSIDSNANPCSDRNQALEVLRELDLLRHPKLQSVIEWLRQARSTERPAGRSLPQIDNIILGNNADAVDAAGVRAVELGYRYVMQSSRQPEGDVQLVAEQTMSAIRQLLDHDLADCWISGGEPTVRLPAGGGGKGGRNQQLCLSVLERLAHEGWPESTPRCELVFLSGGTDGEDGPTDAAGAYFDAATIARMRSLPCDPATYLANADAYHFFSQVGGLLQTGPTGTNVCDLRIALCSPTYLGAG